MNNRRVTFWSIASRLELTTMALLGCGTVVWACVDIFGSGAGTTVVPPSYNWTWNATGLGSFFVFLVVHYRVEQRLARFRNRLAAGQCPACGYDLRASPGRCPECGRSRT